MSLLSSDYVSDQIKAEAKTWINIKTFIATEYARENKQNKLTAKQFKANLIKEQAKATQELIATLAENHTRQMETLIKSMTDAMKEIMQLIKSNSTTPTNPIILSDDGKKKKRDEKQKKFNEAPVCTHCGKKYPTKKDDECWELEKNKSSHPDNWKLSKAAKKAFSKMENLKSPRGRFAVQVSK